jgi:preprotein translocase SecE subunit
VAEWSIATVLKTVVRETAPGVRIPPPPPKGTEERDMKDYLPMIIGIVIATAIFTYLWREGMFLRLSGYFRETQDELKKCTWPNWDDLVGSTTVVMVSVALLGGFTVAVDFIVANILRLII